MANPIPGVLHAQAVRAGSLSVYEAAIKKAGRELGIDVASGREKHVGWLAEAFLLAPLPTGWYRCRDKNGRVYYYDKSSRSSSWLHPCRQQFGRLQHQSGGLAEERLFNNQPASWVEEVRKERMRGFEKSRSSKGAQAFKRSKGLSPPPQQVEEVPQILLAESSSSPVRAPKNIQRRAKPLKPSRPKTAQPLAKRGANAGSKRPPAPPARAVKPLLRKLKIGLKSRMTLIDEELSSIEHSSNEFFLSCFPPGVILCQSFANSLTFF